jgi:hypothetical protein
VGEPTGGRHEGDLDAPVVEGDLPSLLHLQDAAVGLDVGAGEA